MEQLYACPAQTGPGRVLKFDPEKCVGCNFCVEVCPLDVMIPNPERGKEPIVVFAEECWFCGACAADCPHGALELVAPAKQRISAVWKDKESGREFRVGMKNPPAPNNTPVAGAEFLKR